MIVSVQSRQAIRRVPFAAPLPLGMEVMTLSRLRAMAVKAARKLGQFCRLKTGPVEGWCAGGFWSEP